MSTPEPPDPGNRTRSVIFAVLKVLGVLVLVVVIAAGIALGTCMYMFRSR